MHDFDTIRYKTYLRSTSLGRNIAVFPELESTNTWLKTAVSSGLSDGMICLADRQIKGRGQYQKHWVSEPCANLTWSYLLKPDTHDRLFLLALACIHAVATVIERNYDLGARIKWPNDLMVNGKKMAGVLAEAVFNGNHLERFIVGVGLNVNQRSFPDYVPEAASIAQFTGQYVDREYLLAEIVNETDLFLHAWMGKDTNLVQQINRRLIGYGKRVRVSVDGIAHDGDMLLLGVNNHGHLLVLDNTYTVHTYSYEQVRIDAHTI